MIDLLALIWKDCPECGGVGKVPTGVIDEVTRFEETQSCEGCGGTGKVPRYFTPTEWTEATGIEFGPDTPVWLGQANERPEHSRFRDGWLGYPTTGRKTYDYIFINLSALGQPRPPEDYRHE